MVLATHEMGFAREVASRVCFLAEGVVARGGPPSRSSANRRLPGCRASCVGSSRPAGCNSLAGLRKLRPARLAALGRPGRSRPIPHSRERLGFNAGTTPRRQPHFVTDLLRRRSQPLAPTCSTRLCSSRIPPRSSASTSTKSCFPSSSSPNSSPSATTPSSDGQHAKEPAPARGSPRAVRLARATDADHTARGHAPRRDQPHGRNRAAGRAHR